VHSIDVVEARPGCFSSPADAAIGIEGFSIPIC
jgi:hypothetical protein